MQHSLIVIIPYFGGWPFWMELFLASCAANPTVNWYLAGDCGKPSNMPDNVCYKFFSFADYKQLVSGKLGIEFNPSSPYKLCDIKPMLGKIHEEEIKGYDFWAFGDLDLVYGDLRKVYTGQLLAAHDLISTHATRVSGHLCVIRNNTEMRDVFSRVPGWKEIISSDKHYAFDEKAFSRLFVKHKNFPGWLRRVMNVLFYPLARKSLFVERFTTPDGCIAWRDGSFKFPEAWFWSKEAISNSFQAEPELLYFHFAVWKKSSWPGAGKAEKIVYLEGATYRFDAKGISLVGDTA